MQLKLRDDQGLKAIELTEAELGQLKATVLRPFGVITRGRIRDWLKSDGEGSWAPPADSTKKRWDATGTSQISKRGTVRAPVRQRLERQIQTLQERIKRGGYSERNKRALARLQKRIEKLQKAEEKAQAKPYQKRNIGKRVSEKRTKLLERMPGTLRVGIRQNGDNFSILWYSQAGAVASFQENGFRTTPGRVIFDESLLDEDQLAEMIADALARAWEEA